MTTIVASVKEGVMCSDSQWTDGDECGPAKKIFRCRGELLGLAGDMRHCLDWMAAWRKKPFDKLKGVDSCVVLRLSKSGLFVWTNPDAWTPAYHQFAIGSGGKAARAALAAGATCRQATRIAIDIDAGTGGRVRMYRL